MNWIYLAHEREKWWAVVYTIMNLWVPQNVEDFFSSRGAIRFPRTLVAGVC